MDEVGSRHRQEMLRHNRLVRQYGGQIAHATIHLIERHDLDTLEPKYASQWEKFYPYIKAVFGSAEYRTRQEEMKGLLDEHRKRTRHHPERWEEGIGAMNLMEVSEYVADNLERCRSRGDGNLRRSLEINQGPHKIQSQTMSIILNTADYFNWL